uniref:Putative LAGLIDADG homing endonuclease n=1 Tax=Staurocarteria cerasiformis TaxID=69401 RepID=A0A0S2LQE3_STACE|nr:putative LAGLIDADG homing endonuclease [Carteria cerasiformis]YP_009185168.1 putative LAGLIDADG homing endonuclease [Carteria cerasiformis]ALO63474.1 putative LAGLIDADG homing endonuclease [Carteria cerasiformis]ALO63478.1 putative LAGLIDADG homing endonuclease [Carteria cerasiformis]
MKQHVALSSSPPLGPIYFGPGEPTDEALLLGLKEVNNKYSQSKDFSKYVREIETLFRLKPRAFVTESEKHFLAGFIEGEGSFSVSAKRTQYSQFGLCIDPEFNITQHVNGVLHLQLALYTFKTGRIAHKGQSRGTLTFRIDNRKSLTEKVVPYVDKYLIPYSCPSKINRVETFKELLSLFDQNAHCDLNSMLNQVLPLWASMRVQVGHPYQTFKSLEEAQDYVKLYLSNKDSPTFLNALLEPKRRNKK